MGYKENMQTISKFSSLAADDLLWQIFQRSHICLLLFTPDGKIYLANKEAERLFGKNLISHQVNDLFHAEGSIDLNAWYNNAINGTLIDSQYTYRLKTKGDQTVWGVVNFTLIKESDKSGVILCQIRNISELREAQEKTDYQTQLLIELVNSIPDNIFIKDRESRFLVANVWVAGIMGVSSPEELIGKTDFDFFPKKLAQKYRQDEVDVLESGQAKLNILEQVVDKNNIRRWYSTSKLPLKDGKGEIIGIMGIGRDITNWIKEQKLLRRTKFAAEKADYLKSAFLANLSHEIRTPLNGILGFSQFIKQTLPNNDRNKKYLDFIISNGNQLLNIINDILDISKLDSGQLKLVQKNIPLKDLLKTLKEEAVEKCMEQSKTKIEVKLEIDLSEKDNLLYDDESRLKQVLKIFLSNAVKYTTKGVITIGCNKENSKNIRFFVRDTGIGIKKEFHELIFERFRQVDDAMNRQYGGIGLGLPIAKGIVKLMCGKIGVISSLDKGAEFYFSIPFTKKEDITEIEPQSEESPLQHKKVILIAENSVSTDLTEILLYQMQVDIWRAKNLEELHNFIDMTEPEPDMVVFQASTRWIDPFDGVQQILNKKQDIPILVILEEASDEKKELCQAAGAKHFLIEPLNLNSFSEKLISMINPLSIQ